MSNRLARHSGICYRFRSGGYARSSSYKRPHYTMSKRLLPQRKYKIAKSGAKSNAKSRKKGATEQPSGLGVRIRHARMVLGITLKELADEAKCSESMLSKIENDKAAPSFGTLHRVATVLGTNISELYSAPKIGDQIVSRAGERPILMTDNLRTGKGIQLERLIPYSREHLLQGNIHRIAPGGGSEAIVHAGEEIGYVLEGEIELVIDGKRLRAKVGDSFHFRSERPHSYRNVGSRTARVLWISTPPTF
jgi:transcriptional regulator with XRE-family HTH domain